MKNNVSSSFKCHNFLWEEIRWLAQPVSLETSEPLRADLDFRDWDLQDLQHLLPGAAGCSSQANAPGGPIPHRDVERSPRYCAFASQPFPLSGSNNVSLFPGGFQALGGKEEQSIHYGHCSLLVILAVLCHTAIGIDTVWWHIVILELFLLSSKNITVHFLNGCLTWQQWEDSKSCFWSIETVILASAETLIASCEGHTTGPVQRRELAVWANLELKIISYIS